jgi:hypothetical protein
MSRAHEGSAGRPLGGTAAPTARIDRVGRAVRRIVLLGCAAALVYALVTLQVNGYRGVRLAWDHATTVARVTDEGPASRRGSGDSRTTVWADLAFTTTAGRPVRTRIFVGIDRAPSVGADMPIDYLPSHPQTVREAGRFWSDDIRLAALMLGFLDLPALALIVWLARWLVRWSIRSRTTPDVTA